MDALHYYSALLQGEGAYTGLSVSDIEEDTHANHINNKQ